MPVTDTYIDKEKLFAEIGYEPHKRQWLYHQSKARFRIASCGRRFGKTTMAARDMEPELFMPNRRYWIVGPQYSLGEKEFRVIWDDLIIGQKLGLNKQVKRAYNVKQGDMYIEFPWRTRLEVRSASHPESLVGEGLHGVIMAEAAKHAEDTWERYIRPALSDYRGWASFCSTPEGMNFFHKLWQYGRDPDFADYDSWRFPSWENRILYPGGREDSEIIAIERTTSPEWFDQEIGADFTAFVGRIFGEFQESTHVKKLEYNPEWTNIMVWDWGFSNPLACIEMQIDAWDNIYIWREHYGGYKTLEQHIQEISSREQPPGYKIDMSFGDAADPEAAMYVTQHYTTCWADPAAKTNWREGIELVKSFLKEYETGQHDEFGTPVMVPKFFVDHSCMNVIREFNNYKAKEAPRNARNRSNPRDEAQNYDNHALDAIRYGLMHMYKLGAQHHLQDTMPALTGASRGSNTIFRAGDLNF